MSTVYNLGRFQFRVFRPTAGNIDYIRPDGETVTEMLENIQKVWGRPADNPWLRGCWGTKLAHPQRIVEYSGRFPIVTAADLDAKPVKSTRPPSHLLFIVG